jgi:lipoprotein-anchoring transpeptidase ErfK/SrfK
MRISVRRVLAVSGVAVLLLGSSAAVGNAGVASVPGVPAVTNVSPTAGEKVGVAYPVTVTFAGPVADHDAVQRSLTVGSIAPHGQFTWLSDREMQFTPTDYWPAHSTLALSVGTAKTSFETGAEVLGVADLDAHTFTVSIDGVVQRTMPASMGKAKHPTPIGSFTALEKQKSVVMDSRTIGIPLSDPEGYKLTVADAVRVTWGGVYVHSAPWSIAQQGNSNVSHGCINLSPDNAAWYYDTVSVGDPIVVQA